MPYPIPLTQGKFASVDSGDLRRVMKRKWCVRKSHSGNYYAQTNMKVDGEWRRVSLHTFILGAEPGVQIDHKDGNGLNCTRENMRVATHSQNMHNQRSRGGTSRFKGVSWHNRAKKWVAQICESRKKRYLGLFECETDAAKAYDKAAKELHGDFARLNFPDQPGDSSC